MEAATGATHPLARDADGVFHDRVGDALVGPVEFVGTDAEGREVGRRRLRFVEGPIRVDYKPPSTSVSWVVEDVGEESTPWSSAHATADAEHLYPQAVLPALQQAHAAGFSTLLDPGREAATPDAPSVSRWHTAVDVAAALGSRRAGLGEGEFLSLLTDLAGVPEGSALWATARAWVELGAVDVLAPASWANRTYVARRPQWVSWDQGRRVALVGLVPASLRSRVAVLVPRIGAVDVTAPAASPWVPPIPAFHAPDPSVVEDLACQTDLGPVARLRSLDELLAWPGAAALQVEGPPPQGHVSAASWDWARGTFMGPAAPKGVALDRYDHPRDASRYVVSDGPRAWCFRSRAWAFLWALALRGDPAFAYDASGRLASVGPTPAHLPVPVARAIACTSGSPGPLTDGQGGVRYLTPVSSEARRALDHAWFRRVTTVPADAVHLARRILSQTAQSSAPAVPLPSRLARGLAAYADDPAVGAIHAGRVPVAVIPHVVKLVSLLRTPSS